MGRLAEVTAAVVFVLNGITALYGGFRWWRVEPSRAFWVLARAGQAAAVAQAVVGGVLLLSGFKPPDGLYWVYSFTPVAVSYFAEQLRIASAETVLEARGLEDSAAVGRLDDAGQRSVVLSIVRREMGVAALSALVIAFLSLRALGTV
jgi:hypothetical protein